MNKLFQNITFWVILCSAIGIAIGYYCPNDAIKYKFLGDGFIDGIKLFAYPAVFLTVCLGICNASNLRQSGIIGMKAILYFEIVTTFALLTGLCMVLLFKPGDGVMASHEHHPDAAGLLSKSTNFNTWVFLKGNLILQILFVALISGIAISNMASKQRFVIQMEKAMHLLFKYLKYFMYMAPIAACSSMAYSIGKYGISSLLILINLMACVYGTMTIFIFLILNLILKYYKINLWSLLKYLKEELILVLGTSSSEPALPALMQKLENLGCSKSVVGIVIPAGYSFNLDGTSIYLSMATLFLAQVYKVPITVDLLISIIAILLVTSKGAAGITGAGFIVLSTTLSSIKSIPQEGIVLLLGIDRFMSEARAITNFIGNGVGCLWIAKNTRQIDEEKLQKILG